MKKVLLTIAIAALASTSQAALIAYWDMNGATGTGQEFNGTAATLGSGTLDQTEVGNAFGSGFIHRAATGTANNAIAPSLAGERLRFRDGQRTNGSFIEFTLDLTSFQDVVLTYDYAGENNAFSNSVFEYSLTGDTAAGGSFVNIQSGFSLVTGGAGTWQLETFDMSSITAIEGQSNVVFRLTADGAGAGNVNSYIDNVQFNGVAIPEPSTFGLVGLGLLGIFFLRRRANN